MVHQKVVMVEEEGIVMMVETEILLTKEISGIVPGQEIKVITPMGII